MIGGVWVTRWLILLLSSFYDLQWASSLLSSRNHDIPQLFTKVSESSASFPLHGLHNDFAIAWFSFGNEEWLTIFFEEEGVGKLDFATFKVHAWRQKVLDECGERNDLVHIELHILKFVRVKQLRIFHLQLTDGAIHGFFAFFVCTTSKILFRSDATFFVNHNTIIVAFPSNFLLGALVYGFAATCIIRFDLNIAG